MVGERQQHGTQRRRRQQNDFDSTSLKAACDAWCKDEGAAREKYGDIAEWKVGNVESFASLFFQQYKFNGDISKISKWNMESATSTYAMFYYASVFNSDISKISKWNMGRWDMSSAKYTFNGEIPAACSGTPLAQRKAHHAVLLRQHICFNRLAPSMVT